MTRTTGHRLRWLAVTALVVGVGVGLSVAVRKVRDAASHLAGT